MLIQRKNFTRTIVAAGVLLVASICATRPAYAYIDPNAGGALFQLLTPIAAIASAFLIALRRKISAWWSAAFRLRKKDKGARGG